MSGPLTVELKVGVVGGFAPAVLKQHVVIRADDAAGRVRVERTRLKPGKKTFHPQDDDYERFAGDVAVGAEQWTAVAGVLEHIWSLPTETPPGAEDIYRQDTMIRVQRDGREWVNNSPAGCVHAQSATETTAEQRNLFKRIATAITELADKAATAPA